MDKDLQYYLALSAVPDIGPYSVKKLLRHFKTPENIFNASLSELLKIDGIGRNRAEHISSFSNWTIINKTVDILNKKGIKVVRPGDQGYPSYLAQINSSPLLLYIKGDLKDEDRFSIAIVGSRKATPYGINITEKIAGELSSLGFTIVSGMARGIDTTAHKAALKEGGRTIAVLGSGMDVVYPPENRGLMERIVENGAVITEFPLGTKPNRENFPIRNRLISGLSMGVLVVEATENSGSLITANYANEQGKEVFAIPGNITSDNTKGVHRLIKGGAKLVHNVNDIVEELAPLLKGLIKDRKLKAVALEKDEKKVADILSSEPMHIDDIIRQSGISSNRLLTLLLNLELKGVVKQIDGKKFLLH